MINCFPRKGADHLLFKDGNAEPANDQPARVCLLCRHVGQTARACAASCSTRIMPTTWRSAGQPADYADDSTLDHWVVFRAVDQVGEGWVGGLQAKGVAFVVDVLHGRLLANEDDRDRAWCGTGVDHHDHLVAVEDAVSGH